MDGKYQGVVKSFNAQKGWGFIECELTQQMYGKDMFVLKNALPGGHANKGDQVLFTVVQEHNGPIASEVQVVQRAPGALQPPTAATALVPVAAAAGGKFAAAGKGGAAAAAVAAAAAAAAGGGGKGAAAGQSFVGTIKSFSDQNGWGMIANPQMTQAYGKDVFFSKAAVVGGVPAAGAQVSFTIKMEAKGPAAASVQVLWSQGPASAGLAIVPAMAGWNGSAKGTQRPPAMNMNMNQFFFGILKSFNEERGWGHIACDATNRLYGKDVFLMKGALEGQAVLPGTLLSFKVNAGAKGPQANSVTMLPPGSFRIASSPSSDEPVVYSGQVKTFNAEKGWGFVASEELQQAFGKDIFIHKRELEGHVPGPGEAVQIIVEIDDKGQPVGKSASSAYGPGLNGSISARVAPY